MRFLLFFLLLIPLLAESALEKHEGENVLVLSDDLGQWGGASTGMTHQLDPRYQAKKTLDLSAVPESAWAAVSEVRLSAFFCVRDYSPASLGKANGLDEAFEILVNGKAHRFPNHGGAPVYPEGKATAMEWFDFALPKEEFVRGRNEIVFRKAPTPATKPKPDDYLYLGIDNTAPGGNSAVSLDGGRTWQDGKLNSLGAGGEYMVRLVLLSGERRVESVWRSGALADPAGFVAHAGRRPGSDEFRMEWLAHKLDATRSVAAVVQTEGAAKFVLRWLDAEGQPMPPVQGAGPRFETQLPGQRTSGVIVTGAPVQSLTVSGTRGYRQVEPPIDLCPPMAKPAGAVAKREPSCRIEDGAVVLKNAHLRCRFETGGRLKLVSIFNELANAEIVRQPGKLDLFLVEIGAQRSSGSRDFECRSVRAKGGAGFVADLFLPAHSLAATLEGSMDSEGLRLGLALKNSGDKPLDFKLAFPHLAGLAVSPDPAADYYFFPRGGGIIADRPAIVRQGYGDHQALYQVMDLFSPSLGAGLSLRVDDAEGRYKVLGLRKSLPGKGEGQVLAPLCPAAPEVQWRDPFERVDGVSLAVEYLRRTRGPGGTFAPAPAVVAAHAGDWKTPMKAYAAWAHRVWKFRPYPSRLGDVATMIAAGWGGDLLFKDGKYRTDFLKPGRDCLELMSWWEWSPLGPWSTPFDQLEAKIGAAGVARWRPYFVKDPVTGRTMWNNQPGDYRGYNARFGGLPTFRKAVQDYKRSGALITLYTDPFRLDESSETGREHGKEWGVVLPSGEPSRSYEVWNPCHDLPEVRQWVADTMRRVMRETGADGIRLDEYGHRGWACHHPGHRHTFAEPGCTEWQRATAEAAKGIRAAMDEVDPKSVLTTEHPGYDFLMQHLDGCITYDLTVQATPLRPLECNAQRFYFPECKAYELDHRGADKDCHKRLWNLVASFGREFPAPIYAIFKDYADVVRSRDCEPLVPTLKPFVYANRFSSGGRTLWTLYNATGHTYEGPVLEVDLAEGQRLVELLSGRELAFGVGGKRRIDLYLPRNGAACVARLPKAE